MQWLGKPAAAPKVPGSNPGLGMNVKLSFLLVAARFRAKNYDQEVSGSILGRACRPSRSEFSVIFSETRVNMG